MGKNKKSLHAIFSSLSRKSLEKYLIHFDLPGKHADRKTMLGNVVGHFREYKVEDEEAVIMDAVEIIRDMAEVEKE